MPFDSAIDVSVNAEAAQSAAQTEELSAEQIIGPLPAIGMTFNFFLKLNSGAMTTRTATAKLYLGEKTGGTFVDAGTVTFADAAATTTKGAHKSLQVSRDLLSQVSTTIPSQISYKISIADDGTTGDAAVNYALTCYPALDGWTHP